VGPQKEETTQEQVFGGVCSVRKTSDKTWHFNPPITASGKTPAIEKDWLQQKKGRSFSTGVYWKSAANGQGRTSVDAEKFKERPWGNKTARPKVVGGRKKENAEKEVR